MPAGPALSPAATTPNPRKALAAGAMLLALLATGCGTEDDTAADSSASEDTGQVETPEAGAEEAESEDGSDIAVEIVGESPHALVSPHTPEGPTVDVSGELIIGPGGYMALAQAGQPQVLVFSEGTEFTFGDNAPSVTTSEQGTVRVGETIDLTGVEYPVTGIEGVPHQQLRGADEQILFITND